MVSAAHRSRAACHGCRSKKQKCDGEKPTCARCRALNHSCVWPVTQKRGPAKGFVEALEHRLDETERALLHLLSALDDESLAAAFRNSTTSTSTSTSSPSFHSAGAVSSLLSPVATDTVVDSPQSTRVRAAAAASRHNHHDDDDDRSEGAAAAATALQASGGSGGGGGGGGESKGHALMARWEQYPLDSAAGLRRWWAASCPTAPAAAAAAGGKKESHRGGVRDSITVGSEVVEVSGGGEGGTRRGRRRGSGLIGRGGAAGGLATRRYEEQLEGVDDDDDDESSTVGGGGIQGHDMTVGNGLSGVARGSKSGGTDPSTPVVAHQRERLAPRRGDWSAGPARDGDAAVARQATRDCSNQGDDDDDDNGGAGREDVERMEGVEETTGAGELDFEGVATDESPVFERRITSTAGPGGMVLPSPSAVVDLPEDFQRRFLW